MVFKNDKQVELKQTSIPPAFFRQKFLHYGLEQPSIPM